MSSGSSPAILVFDDDPWSVSWIEDVAAASGFACKIVATYDEAVASYDLLRPVVAVVDIRVGDVALPLVGATLTGVDPSWVGLRFLNHVRNELKDAKVRLFVYTGLDREELQRVVENAYGGVFFTKFEASAFRAALKAELARLASRKGSA